MQSNPPQKTTSKDLKSQHLIGNQILKSFNMDIFLT
jgi:hypothetical protein